MGWEPFARLVLEASYEAVFRVAMLTALRHGGRAGSNRVFLTCLGGGVFGNPLNWIVDAMEAAMRKFSRVNLEVFIVTYGGHVNAELERLEESFAGSSEEPPKQTRCRRGILKPPKLGKADQLEKPISVVPLPFCDGVSKCGFCCRQLLLLLLLLVFLLMLLDH